MNFKVVLIWQNKLGARKPLDLNYLNLAAASF